MLFETSKTALVALSLPHMRFSAGIFRASYQSWFKSGGYDVPDHQENEKTTDRLFIKILHEAV